MGTHCAVVVPSRHRGRLGVVDAHAVRRPAVLTLASPRRRARHEVGGGRLGTVTSCPRSCCCATASRPGTQQNLFTGWHGRRPHRRSASAEAAAAGRLLPREPGLDLRVVHTSVLTRAIRTAELALHAAGRSWLPVRAQLAAQRAPLRRPDGQDKKETAEHVRHRPGAARGAAATTCRRRHCPTGDPRRSDGDPRYRDVPRRHAAGDGVPEGRRRARAAVLRRRRSSPDLRGEGARGGAVLRRRPRQLDPRAAHAPRGRSPEDEIVDARGPDGHPVRLRARRRRSTSPRVATSATPRPRRRRRRAVARQAGLAHRRGDRARRCRIRQRRTRRR